MVRGGRPGHALANFDASQYGPEYLSLERHEALHFLISREEDGGWALGQRPRESACGWFPASYWAAGPPPQAGQGLQAPGTATPPLARAAKPEPVAESEAAPAAPNEPSPEGCVYDRGFLLHVGVAMFHAAAAAQEVPPDLVQIKLDDRPQQYWPTEPKPETRPRPVETKPRPSTREPQEVVQTIVDLCGGRAKVGKIAAAVIALGIMPGIHCEVCRDIVAAVRARPDLFGDLECPPLPGGAAAVPKEQDYGKLTVVLRTESLEWAEW